MLLFDEWLSRMVDFAGPQDGGHQPQGDNSTTQGNGHGHPLIVSNEP